MTNKTSIPVDISRFLERSHTGIIQKIGQLNEVLTNLRYEGKPTFGKNLRNAKAIFDSFTNELTKDMEFEEKVLFPYLETHVPKLKFMIHILEEEHGDLKGNLETLCKLFRELIKEGYDGGQIDIIEKMRKKGGYLNYFLHNHTWAEGESVYKVMDVELNKDEKLELRKRLRHTGLKSQ